MEMAPFGKGSSDIIWALPFFALMIFALAMPGLLVALRATHQTAEAGKFAMAGLVLNALSLAIPILLLGSRSRSASRFDRCLTNRSAVR
jgi:hypothetical protein